jgi:hypothetical protein
MQQSIPKLISYSITWPATALNTKKEKSEKKVGMMNTKYFVAERK